MYDYFRTIAINSLQEILEETGNKIADSLAKKIGPEGQYYDRTEMVEFAFRNPPKVKIQGKEVVWSLYNVSIVVSFKGLKGKFNHHMSVSGEFKSHGKDIPALVPYWLEKGFKMPNGGKHRGYAYYDSVFGAQGIDQYIIDRFALRCMQKINNGIK